MIPVQTLVLIALAIGIAVAIIIYFFVSQLRKLKEELKGDDNQVLLEWLKDMKGSVEKSSETLDKHLKDQRESLENQLRGQREAMLEQNKVLGERLDKAQDVIRNVSQQLGGIQEFGKSIKDLNNVLQSPKLRGGLGEQFLYDILANTLPQDLFKTQYKFKNGLTCDAVILTDRGLIPVDSKFPMENFRAMAESQNDLDREKCKKAFIMDVKKRIDEISSKYILPDENTTDQAIMYVPSESVFYELIVNAPQIEDYCKEKGVVMASPNTFSYFVKIILVAYQHKSLEKSANEILKALGGIKVEAGKFEEELGVLERHITNSYKSMDGVKSRFGKLYGKIESVQLIEGKKEEDQPKLLD